jgi:hypothetical protein
MSNLYEFILSQHFSSVLLGLGFGVVIGALLVYGFQALKLGLRRRVARRVKATHAEINRILSFKLVDERSVLEIARDRMPAGGRHRVQVEEPPVPLMERFRETIDRLMDTWLDMWRGPIGSPELAAQSAYDRARGAVEK